MNKPGEDINDIFIKNVLAICEERKISTVQLATLAGIPDTELENILKGLEEHIHLKTVEGIAKALDVNLVTLLV